MAYTVEDSLEVLAGKTPRTVNIFLSRSDKNIVRSIAEQISNNTGLTDRQLDLVLKKIIKYRSGLLANGIDVDSIVEHKVTRIPLRKIDRSQVVSRSTTDQKKMFIKYNHSKDFFKIWEILKGELLGDIVEKGAIKEFPFNEINVLATVEFLANEKFDFSSEVLDFYENIKKIKARPEEFLPCVDFTENKIVLRNTSKYCQEYIDRNFSNLESKNLPAYLDRLKNCGIKQKDQKILEKIHNFACSDLTKKTLVSPATRFRIKPDTSDISNIVEIISELDQWPVLVMVEEGDRAVGQVISTIDAFSSIIDKTSMTVFFRLDNSNDSSIFFNQYIRENQLNNQIDKNTKVVFVSKTRIPKPLIRIDWNPMSAIVMATNDFGKSGAYLDGLPTVYYYNNALSMRVNRTQGTRSIVEL